MTNLMEESYNKEIGFYSRYIASHYHYQNSPCTLRLDHKKHDNLQKIMSFAYHVKAAREVTPFANCQIVF